MKIAIVHDFLTQRGGAERVVLSWAAHFDAEIFTSVFAPENTYEGFQGHRVHTTRLQNYSAIRADPRRALPILPRVFRRLHIPDRFDAVLVSTTAVAHHLDVTQPTVVYVHSPARWLYEPGDYFQHPRLPTAMVNSPIGELSKRNDRRAIWRADRVVCNSTLVSERIRRAWDVEADVIPPPTTLLDEESVVPVGLATTNPFVLTVGRARSYKRTREVAEAVEKLRLPLVCVGGLPARPTPWPANFQSVTEISDAQLRWLYKSARIYVAAAREDFGLTVVEANGCGTPVVTPRSGGYIDTVVDGKNGIFAATDDVAGLTAAIDRAFRHPFDNATLRVHAAQFSSARHAKLISPLLVAAANVGA